MWRIESAGGTVLRTGYETRADADDALRTHRTIYNTPLWLNATVEGSDA